MVVQQDAVVSKKDKTSHVYRTTTFNGPPQPLSQHSRGVKTRDVLQLSQTMRQAKNHRDANALLPAWYHSALRSENFAV